MIYSGLLARRPLLFWRCPANACIGRQGRLCPTMTEGLPRGGPFFLSAGFVVNSADLNLANGYVR